MMIEREIEIQMKHGAAEAIYITPADGVHPGILFFTDIRGIRNAHTERARRLAGEGYSVLMPNVFYRTRKPPMFDFSMDWKDPRTQQRFHELVTPLTADAMVEDGRYYIDALYEQPETKKAPIGIAGHCFTAAFGLRLASAYASEVAALATYHGGNLFTEKPDSPHKVLHPGMGKLLFEHAENDDSMPAESILKFESELQASGVKFSSKTIEGAMHGWTVSDHRNYHKEKSEEAYESMKSLFDSTLKQQ